MKPTWVEGSVDERAMHHIDNTALQQHHEEVTELFVIPHIFKPEYRSLLQVSEADVARGGPGDQVSPLPRHQSS